MKVSIDRDLCYGSAECAHRVPSVFTFVDPGYGAVLPGREDTGDDPLIREAAEKCPSQAITITEHSTEHSTEYGTEYSTEHSTE